MEYTFTWTKEDDQNLSYLRLILHSKLQDRLKEGNDDVVSDDYQKLLKWMEYLEARLTTAGMRKPAIWYNY